MYKGTMYNVQRSVLFLLMAMSISLSAQDFSADRELFDAYQREDMSVWKTYIDKRKWIDDNGITDIVDYWSEVEGYTIDYVDCYNRIEFYKVL